MIKKIIKSYKPEIFLLLSAFFLATSLTLGQKTAIEKAIAPIIIYQEYFGENFTYSCDSEKVCFSHDPIKTSFLMGQSDVYSRIYYILKHIDNNKQNFPKKYKKQINSIISNAKIIAFIGKIDSLLKLFSILFLAGWFFGKNDRLYINDT